MGKIIVVGKESGADLLNSYTAKEILDAGGKTIYPGFIDAHAHFISYGQSLFSVDLYDSKSFDEVLDRTQKFAADHPNETWIRGRGWDQNKFPGKSFPNNEKLTALFPQSTCLTGTHRRTCSI